MSTDQVQEELHNIWTTCDLSQSDELDSDLEIKAYDYSLLLCLLTERIGRGKRV